MAASRGNGSSSSRSDALRREVKMDPKTALQKTLAVEGTLPKAMPIALHHIISSYLLPNNMKARVNDWKERKLESAILGRELLDAFAYPDSNVATALNDLTDVERADLLASPAFPELLKFYYLSEKEFKEKINKESKLQEALLFGFDTEERELVQSISEASYIVAYLMKEIKQDVSRLLASEIEFKRLCYENPPTLIHNIKIKYACSFLQNEEDFGSLAASLMKRSSLHLSLPYTDLDCFPIESGDFSGANLRGACLPLKARQLKLCEADLRDSKLRRGGFFSRSECYKLMNGARRCIFIGYSHSIETFDFLNATLDEENKESIRNEIIFTESYTQADSAFKPLADYFNKKYNPRDIFFPTRPSWDLCVHALRITRATNSVEFAKLRSEIPSELTAEKGKFKGMFKSIFKGNEFNSALNEVMKKFLESESKKVPAKKIR